MTYIGTHDVCIYCETQICRRVWDTYLLHIMWHVCPSLILMCWSVRKSGTDLLGQEKSGIKVHCFLLKSWCSTLLHMRQVVCWGETWDRDGFVFVEYVVCVCWISELMTICGCCLLNMCFCSTHFVRHFVGHFVDVTHFLLGIVTHVIHFVTHFFVAHILLMWHNLLHSLWETSFVAHC